jgi:fucose permease
MVSPPSIPVARNISLTGEARRLTVLSCGLFLVIGVVTTILGPILPFLPARLGISPAQAGQLFFWQFVAATITTLADGIIFSRIRFRTLLLTALTLALIGVAGLQTSHWRIACCAVACYGIGLGISIPAINLTVSSLNPTRRSSVLCILNCCWVVGAVAGPMLVFALGTLDRFFNVVLVALAVAILATLIFSSSARIGGDAQAIQPTSWQLRPTVLFSVLLFLAVGVENSLSGWASSVALHHFSNASNASLATAAFWLAFFFSRAGAPLILRRVTDEHLLNSSFLCAIAGVLVFYFSPDAPVALLGCGLAGFGVGTLFPLMLARMTGEMGTDNPGLMVCFAFANLGAALLPPLSGKAGAALGNTSYALVVPLMALLAATILIHARTAESAQLIGAESKRNTYH